MSTQTENLFVSLIKKSVGLGPAKSGCCSAPAAAQSACCGAGTSANACCGNGGGGCCGAESGIESTSLAASQPACCSPSV